MTKNTFVAGATFKFLVRSLVLTLVQKLTDHSTSAVEGKINEPSKMMVAISL